MKKAFTVFIVNCIFLIYIQAQENYTAQLLLDAKASLGEGAFWHPTEKKLYWVDIEMKNLHTFDPVSNSEQHFPLGQKVGTVVPIDTGGVLVALKDGVYAYNYVNNPLLVVSSPSKDLPQFRFNDGKCDPAGRLWVGTMGPKNKAALYRVTAPATCLKMLDSITISNGIVWSLNNTKMYYIDTPTREVKQFDYNNQTGEITNPKVAIKFPKGIGSPDGMTIDCEGMLWIAHWGGSCVGRWDPNAGTMIAKIDLPALNVTSCAFGGEKLDILYITTARVGMDNEKLTQFPLSGGVFYCKPGINGIHTNYFKTKK